VYCFLPTGDDNESTTCSSAGADVEPEPEPDATEQLLIDDEELPFYLKLIQEMNSRAKERFETTGNLCFVHDLIFVINTLYNLIDLLLFVQQNVLVDNNSVLFYPEHARVKRKRKVRELMEKGDVIFEPPPGREPVELFEMEVNSATEKGKVRLNIPRGTRFSAFLIQQT